MWTEDQPQRHRDAEETNQSQMDPDFLIGFTYQHLSLRLCG